MSERDEWVRAMSPARRQEILTLAKSLTTATGIDVERAEQLILSGMYANEQRSKDESPRLAPKQVIWPQATSGNRAPNR